MITKFKDIDEMTEQEMRDNLHEIKAHVESAYTNSGLEFNALRHIGDMVDAVWPSHWPSSPSS